MVPLLDEVFDPLDSGQVQHEYVAVLQPAADLHAAAATAVYADAKGWAIVVPPEAWAGGLCAAVLIGALAGLLPAIRASRLSPTTQALRAL